MFSIAKSFVSMAKIKLGTLRSSLTLTNTVVFGLHWFNQVSRGEKPVSVSNCQHLYPPLHKLLLLTTVDFRGSTPGLQLLSAG